VTSSRSREALLGFFYKAHRIKTGQAQFRNSINNVQLAAEKQTEESILSGVFLMTTFPLIISPLEILVAIELYLSIGCLKLLILGL
jgi:hypothetical protein